MVDRKGDDASSPATRVLFRTATEWVVALGDARRAGRLKDEFTRLARIPG